MRIQEKFNLLKQEYEDYIILLKNGNFYTTYNDDAYILNYLFNYKIIDFKVGFPINSLDKVINLLCDKKINVYVIEEDKKQEFVDNFYKEILKVARDNYYLELNNKVLLEEIENLLKTNPENIKKIRNFINQLWFYSSK